MYLKKHYRSVENILETEIEEMLSKITGKQMLENRKEIDFMQKAILWSRGSKDIDLRVDMIQWYEYPSQALCVAYDNCVDLLKGNSITDKRTYPHAVDFLKMEIEKKVEAKEYDEIILSRREKMYKWIDGKDLDLGFKIEMLEKFNDPCQALVHLLALIHIIDRDDLAKQTQK